VASVASTWPMGIGVALAGTTLRTAERMPPVAPDRAPRASLGTTASWTVPQAWHSPHRPVHLADCQPHSVQRKADPADDLAIAAP
jgi:hypothetical protein